MYYHHVFRKNKTQILFCLGKRTKSKRDGLFLLANSAIFQGLNCKHGTKMVVPVRIHVRLLSGNQLVNKRFSPNNVLSFCSWYRPSLKSNATCFVKKYNLQTTCPLSIPPKRSASLRGERRGAPRKEAEHC